MVKFMQMRWPILQCTSPAAHVIKVHIGWIVLPVLANGSMIAKTADGGQNGPLHNTR